MAQRPQPVVFRWDPGLGEFGAMVPERRFRQRCEAQFEGGEEYPLEVVAEASSAAKAHFFASLHEAHENLREDIRERYREFDYFRHWAMVQCGYCHQRDLVLASNEEVLRVASMVRLDQPYSILIAKDNVLRRFDAESVRTMKRDRFTRMSRDVLDFAASLAKTTRRELERAGRHGANS